MRFILTEPWREVNNTEPFIANYSDGALGVKATLEKYFDCEMLEQLQSAWGRHDPDRVGRRNGYEGVLGRSD